jgi:hypothetical protein
MAKLIVNTLNQTQSVNLCINGSTAEDLVFELINGGWAPASSYDPDLENFRSIVSTEIFVQVEEGQTVL